jgi:hypothetical protein
VALVRRGARAPRLAAFTLLAALAPAFARAGEAAPAKAQPCAHLRLVDASASARAFLSRLGDDLAGELPSLDAAVVSSFQAERLFRLDDPDAACLTAWVVLEKSRALVRLAGPKRRRFVFRDLEVGQPLTELDRERVSQVARVGLSTIGEGGETLERAQALAATAEQAADAEAPQAALVAAPSPLPVPRFAPAFTIGANYGGTFNRNSLFSGPGVTLAVGGTSHPLDPEVWLDVRYVMPHSYEDANASLQTIAGRIGASARWRLLRVGVGVGLDREHLSAVVTPANDPSFQSATTLDLGARLVLAARLSAQVATRDWRGVSLSATLLVDVVQSTVRTVSDPPLMFYFYDTDTVRPGFSLELSWRS